MHADTDGIVPGNALVVSFKIHWSNNSQLWNTIITRWTPRNSSDLSASLATLSWIGGALHQYIDSLWILSPRPESLPCSWLNLSPFQVSVLWHQLSGSTDLTKNQFYWNSTCRFWKASPSWTRLASSVERNKEQVRKRMGGFSDVLLRGSPSVGFPTSQFNWPFAESRCLSRVQCHIILRKNPFVLFCVQSSQILD